MKDLKEMREDAREAEAELRRVSGRFPVRSVEYRAARRKYDLVCKRLHDALHVTDARRNVGFVPVPDWWKARVVPTAADFRPEGEL